MFDVDLSDLALHRLEVRRRDLALLQLEDRVFVFGGRLAATLPTEIVAGRVAVGVNRPLLR